MAKVTTFTSTWRAKWLCDGATSIEEMASMLDAAAANLRSLAAQGVSLDGKVEDDYAELLTTDPAVAKANEFEKA